MLVKKLKKKILALISVFFLSFSFSMAALNELNSGSAATQQGETDNLASIDIGSFAYVLTVLGIEETQVMSFGAFTPGSGGTINTSGDTTGGVTSIQNVTNITNAQPSVISMTGDPEENFSLVINGLSPIVTLTNTADNSQTMTMDLDLVQEDRTFSEAGSSSKSISGTLNVGANQLAGLYSGTYTVEIFYIN